MNEVIKELFERKSVRDYLEKEIEPEKKSVIIEAALNAPTAGNMTLYTVIDVTDQAVKEKLAVTCDHQAFIAKAPMVLVFCADYQKWVGLFRQYEDEVRKPDMGDFMLAFDDALIAAQNAVTAAHSLGIGSCYIGDIMESYEIHKELFHLPQYVVPAALLVFGYPTRQQEERKKPERMTAESVVCENVYRSLSPDEYAAVLGERQRKDGEDLEVWIKAFCKRKWNSDFSREMSRSVRVMMQSWLE